MGLNECAATILTVTFLSVPTRDYDTLLGPMPCKDSTFHGTTTVVIQVPTMSAHIQFNNTGFTTTSIIVVSAGVCPKLASPEKSPNGVKPS